MLDFIFITFFHWFVSEALWFALYVCLCASIFGPIDWCVCNARTHIEWKMPHNDRNNNNWRHITLMTTQLKLKKSAFESILRSFSTMRFFFCSISLEIFKNDVIRLRFCHREKKRTIDLISLLRPNRWTTTSVDILKKLFYEVATFCYYQTNENERSFHKISYA